MQIREDVGQRLLSIHQGSRQVDFRIPKTDTMQPSVTFSKQGQLDDGDLPLLGRLMLLSNDLNLQERVTSSGHSMVCPPSHPIASVTYAENCHTALLIWLLALEHASGFTCGCVHPGHLAVIPIVMISVPY